jgi:hypothetical protein
MSVPVRLLSAAALLLASLAAHADTYDYTFHDSDAGTTYFTYDSPVLITTDTRVTPLTCEVDSNILGACTTVEINPTGGEVLISTARYGVVLDNFGLPQSFFQVGDHSSGGSTLDIVDVPSASSSVTPEPSGLVLLGTGALGLAGSLRRRLLRS